MIPLPFRVEDPLLGAICTLLISAICAVLFVLHRRGHPKIVGLFDAYLRPLKFGAKSDDAFRGRQRVVLASFAVLFGLGSVFAWLLVTGVAVPEKPPPPETWPKDPEGLVRNLNSYGADLLETYEQEGITKDPDPRGMDRSHPFMVHSWVEMHREKLNALGYDFHWDARKRKYVLDPPRN